MLKEIYFYIVTHILTEMKISLRDNYNIYQKY